MPLLLNPKRHKKDNAEHKLLTVSLINTNLGSVRECRVIYDEYLSVCLLLLLH